ncbi:hypothetical protein H257_15304 [Aphanomyces astaci]|uniref:Uncharacterized protein n=1 Tax=Aphanomyces astaci TaxID=112090 RepID=W4FPE8_APHAT|nr:hypothetical protein H257_15304 [Aphanomyces astaci]ETV68694.1 hypothetical protein H257_15304 [Aphanomyces astaci]|eukprot:XP_009841648.1 hypothetical protein H257_15304 [Aphanomyces astaci]
MGRNPKLTDRTKAAILREASKAKARLLKNTEHLEHVFRAATPMLTAAQKAPRLKWAETYVTLDEAWKRIVFSDEKKFNLVGSDEYHKYWYDKRQPKQQRMNRQQGSGSFMIWAAFLWSGKSRVALLQGRQRGRFIPQPVPEATNMDHSSAGMTPPPTARPRGHAATSGVQDDDATMVPSARDLATLTEQAATPGSGAHASSYSFLRMHTVLSHGIVDLRNSIQRNERSLRVLQEVRAAMASTLGSGPHDMSQACHGLVDEVEFLKATLSEVNAERLKSRSEPWSKDNTTPGSSVTKPRPNDQQEELWDLASRLTAQTEKVTELGRRVKEADQALEVMTAEVNDARDYTAHSARLVAGKEGVVKLALQNKSLVVAEMSDLRRSLEAGRENSEKARQDRDRALPTAGELQEQLRVAQDRIAKLEAQPLRFSASNPAWDILLAENQDLREAAKTQKARAKDSRVRNKILRSQTETFQADALQKLGALESRVQGYESQDQLHREDLVQLEKLLREKQASHDLEEKLQAFQESERTSARALLHANEHFQDAVPSFWDWVAQHLQVSGAAGVAPLIEAWTLSDPDRFKSCIESVGIFPAKVARGLTEPLLGRVRGPTFSAWVNMALPVMRDALKESSTPSSGVLEADVVEAPRGSGAKGSTLPGQAGAKAPVPPSPSRSTKRSASGGRPGKRKVSRVHTAVPLPFADPNLHRDVDATYMAVASSTPGVRWPSSLTNSSIVDALQVTRYVRGIGTLEHSLSCQKRIFRVRVCVGRQA